MMESIEKLREWSRWLDGAYAAEEGGHYHVYNRPLTASMKSCGELMREQCGEIEREIAEKYQLLPVDADGVPIRVGDMVSLNGREPFEVGGVRDTRNQWHVFPYDLQRWYAPLDLHHVKPRTIEDVLTDLVNEVARQGHQIGLTGHELTMRYAAEIRELMEVDR